MDYNVIGKKVSVSVPRRDSNLKEISGDRSANIVGICTYFGYNQMLETWQITVDRAPIFLENLDKIKII